MMYEKNLKPTIAPFSLGETSPLSSIDASPEFHDPYSDLSLFLAKKNQTGDVSHRL